MRLVLALVIITSLGGCATVSNPIPDDYRGPIVALFDTSQQESSSKGQFFVALEIDGMPIQNGIRETRQASYGKGFALSARSTSRNVPARPMKVKLMGTHQTAAPIHEIASRAAGTFFSVEGTVDFSPVEGTVYEVSGELSKELSCVYIVESQARKLVTKKACSK